ncbi:protein KIBRA, partial [Erinaceus europaeus]|uniref:Protein KIBRA n=1 Tax=Erinaceus europaeus TaxID=9365 RepID=A0ABM3XVZ3_ERIEU
WVSVSQDAVSALLEQTATELEKQEARRGVPSPKENWGYEEASENEAEEEEEEDVVFTERASPDAEESPVLKVDKETNTEPPAPSPTVVRPKERRVGTPCPALGPFLRGGTVIRSQTFSPGPQSQYICRLNRSDSDSSTLARKPPFVRNSLERRSVRVKRAPSGKAPRAERVLRTSLDLELDLQASRTRHSQLVQELAALRSLRERLERGPGPGPPELPAGLRRDPRLRLLLRALEKQVDRAEHRGELQTDRLMRAAARDVLQLRGQSSKEPPEVQSFREKMAFFTRPHASIPGLSVDDV